MEFHMDMELKSGMRFKIGDVTFKLINANFLDKANNHYVLLNELTNNLFLINLGSANISIHPLETWRRYLWEWEAEIV